MTRTKQPRLIADIEPNIALANAMSIEREHSIPISEPTSPSFHQAARVARARYLRDLFARVAILLTSGGLDNPADLRLPCGSGGDTGRSR
jgi:hypothetical protein